MPKYVVGEPDFIRSKKLNEFTLEFSFEGKLDPGQVMWRGIAQRDMRITAMDGNSDIAATASAQFSFTDDGTAVATATWGAGSKTAVGSVTPNVTVAQNSIIKLVAPAVQDSTLDGGTVRVSFSEG